jgi:hypothetical protein
LHHPLALVADIASKRIPIAPDKPILSPKKLVQERERVVKLRCPDFSIVVILGTTPEYVYRPGSGHRG